MFRNRESVGHIVVFLVLAALPLAHVVARAPGPSKVESLRRDTGGAVDLTVDRHTGRMGFVRGRIPLTVVDRDAARTPQEARDAAFAIVARYRELLEVGDPKDELLPEELVVDNLGMMHLRLRQVHHGVPVFAAVLDLHFSADGREVIAIGNGLLPGVGNVKNRAGLAAGEGVRIARAALPGAVPTGEPVLAVYAGLSSERERPAHLAWFVELSDPSLPVRNLYAVDASTGRIRAVFQRYYEALDRQTFDAGNTVRLPGTLVRAEGDPPTGDPDTDDAHDFTGETYDYYLLTHNRDSYDDQGASIRSTVHFGMDFLNAGWNGNGVIYGDGMAARDVVAHELTHGVIDHTAGLVYRWQSGALNESLADIFGAMVDRDDWLMGEDSALGVIRDMAMPEAQGQPAHTDDWVSTCADNQGVHTNSGITNKAYYLAATSLGKDVAERIYYRALATYLLPDSSLEQARAGALQAAADLHGEPSVEYDAVVDAFAAVGLDGTFAPPVPECTCTIQLVANTVPSRDISWVETLALLYRTRDELLAASPAGRHYRSLYEKHTGRIASLLFVDSRLRGSAGRILETLAPGLRSIVDGSPSPVVTRELAHEVMRFAAALAAADRARGGGDLARALRTEIRRVRPARLVGLTFGEAWDRISGSPVPEGAEGRRGR